MQNRRSAPNEITHTSEDRGLFKQKLGQFRVALVPHIKRSSRGDLVIRGYLNDSREVFVIFAGRRARDALVIENRVKALFVRANQAAVKAGIAPPEVNQIRLPVRVEGSWRSRFQRDVSGWDHKSFQLLASRWAFVDGEGMTNLGGRPPVS